MHVVKCQMKSTCALVGLAIRVILSLGVVRVLFVWRVACMWLVVAFILSAQKMAARGCTLCQWEGRLEKMRERKLERNVAHETGGRNVSRRCLPPPDSQQESEKADKRYKYNNIIKTS